LDFYETSKHKENVSKFENEIFSLEYLQENCNSENRRVN
jgi:hypothetical protein